MIPGLTPHTATAAPATTQSAGHASRPSRLTDPKGEEKLRPKAVCAKRARQARQAPACAPGSNVASGNRSPRLASRGRKQSQARRRHLGALSEAKAGQAGKVIKKKRGFGLLRGTEAFIESSAGVSPRPGGCSWGRGWGWGPSGRDARAWHGIESSLRICVCGSDPGGWRQMGVDPAPSREMRAATWIIGRKWERDSDLSPVHSKAGRRGQRKTGGWETKVETDLERQRKTGKKCRVGEKFGP